MGNFTVTTRVQSRDRMGRFIALCDRAAEQAAREMVETAADFAHQDAPVGPPRDDYGRRQKVSSSVGSHMVGATVGVVTTKGPAAVSQETGAGPHPIPNAFGRGFTAIHPGNAPQPYVRPSLKKLQPLIPGILSKYFPG